MCDEFSSVPLPRPHEILHLFQDLQFHFAHILHWITFYCPKTPYDQQQLDFKAVEVIRPGCALVKHRVFGDHLMRGQWLAKVLALSAFVLYTIS